LYFIVLKNGFGRRLAGERLANQFLRSMPAQAVNNMTSARPRTLGG